MKSPIDKNLKRGFIIIYEERKDISLANYIFTNKTHEVQFCRTSLFKRYINLYLMNYADF
jgi:hypothetical protein